MMRSMMTIGLAMAMAGSVAHAQTANSPGVPTSPSQGDDTSRSVNSERDQQLAIDTIRDDVTAARNHNKRLATSRVTAATAADLTVGAAILDLQGIPLGTIEAVKPDGVQVASGGSRVMVPADVFGMRGGKLLLNVTKADFDRQMGAAK